jgi:hypothetical protein
MAGFDANADAKNAVKDAKSHDKEGGDKAYQALQQDIQKELSDPTLSAQQRKDYLNAVSQELKDQGLLPEMTLEWAKQNQASVGKDGKISKDSINDFLGRQYTDFNGNGGLDPLSKSFADNLTQQVGDNKLSSDDLNKAETKERAQSGNRETLSPLYQGNPPLIQVLDGAADGGKLDGHIAEKDLQSYLALAKAINPPPTDGPFSADNQKFVQGLLDGSVKVAGDDGKMKDAPKDFTTGDMAKLSGMSDVPIADAKDKPGAYSDQVKNFNAARADRAGNGPDASDTSTTATTTDNTGQAGTDNSTKTQTDNTPQVTKNGDQVTSIAYPNGRKEEFQYDANDKTKLTQITETIDGKSTVYKADDSGNWGPVGSDGKVTPNGNSNPGIDDNGHYYWMGKDGKYSVVGDDGTVSATDNVHYTDKNGAKISLYPNHNPAEIKYPDGKVLDFGFDDKGNLVSYKNGDGAVFNKGADGKWTDANGQPAPFTQFDVAKDGTVTTTKNDGTKATMTTDGNIQVQPATTTDGSTPSTDNPIPSTSDAQMNDWNKLSQDQQQKVIEEVRNQLIEESKAQSGNGYIKIAARLLGEPDANDTDPKVKALSDALQKLNDTKPLYVGTPTLNSDNLLLFLGQNQDFNDVYQKMILDQAAKEFPDQFGDNPDLKK